MSAAQRIQREVPVWMAFAPALELLMKLVIGPLPSLPDINRASPVGWLEISVVVPASVTLSACTWKSWSVVMLVLRSVSEFAPEIVTPPGAKMTGPSTTMLLSAVGSKMLSVSRAGVPPELTLPVTSKAGLGPANVLPPLRLTSPELLAVTFPATSKPVALPMLTPINVAGEVAAVMFEAVKLAPVSTRTPTCWPTPRTSMAPIAVKVPEVSSMPFVAVDEPAMMMLRPRRTLALSIDTPPRAEEAPVIVIVSLPIREEPASSVLLLILMP
jgi:hypothetical protein